MENEAEIHLDSLLYVWKKNNFLFDYSLFICLHVLIEGHQNIVLIILLESVL